MSDTIPTATPEHFTDCDNDGAPAVSLEVNVAMHLDVALLDGPGNAFERALRLEARATGRDLERFLVDSWRAERARRLETEVLG